jgi:hypothetical protein
VLNGASNDLAIVDAVEQSLFTMVPLGLAPRGLAVKAFELPARAATVP